MMIDAPTVTRPVTIGPLAAADQPAVDALLDEAFGADRHRRTAYRLRKRATPLAQLSLAARARGRLIGSLQCWPVALVAPNGVAHPLVLLGPVAVAADARGNGLGGELIRATLARGGAMPFVLIGDEAYYGRYGFSAMRTAGWTLPGPNDPARLLARGAEASPANGALRPAVAARVAARRARVGWE